MKNVVEGYLKENIDENITIQTWNSSETLPMFMSEIYNFYETNVLGQSCLFVEIINEAPGIEDLKKHLRVISKNVDGNIVFLFKVISSFRRKTLIKNRIPFIVENGQIYLPFLGMDLKKITEENTRNIEKFSSSTQLVFLYFLYNKSLLINATELAELINSTKMTASRALNDLYSLGLLTYEIGGKTGRSKKYRRIDDVDYYNLGSKYLKTPVSSVVYVENNDDDFLIAGLEALSMESMLNPPKRSVRAVSRQKSKDIKQNIIKDRDKIADLNLIELQIWEYEPSLLARNNVVDLVSLAMSISEIKDDRVEQAIEERLKSEKWYTA